MADFGLVQHEYEARNERSPLRILGYIIASIIIVSAILIGANVLSSPGSIWNIAFMEKLLFSTKYSSIDPDLKNIRYPAPVLLAVPTDKLSKLDEDRIIKTWRFGNLTVVEYEAKSFSEILHLYDSGVILSAMSLRKAEAILPEPIRRYLEFIQYLETKTMLPVAISHSLKDMKLVFHHVTYRYTGKNITICVVDTGVDYLHPDLRDSIWVLVSFLYRTPEGHPLVWIRGVNGTLEDAWRFEQQVVRYEGEEYVWMDANGHGCVTPDTIVWTNVTGPVPIKKLYELINKPEIDTSIHGIPAKTKVVADLNIYTIGFDEQTRTFRLVKVYAVHKLYYRGKLVELRLADGTVLRLTPWHPLYVVERVRRPDGRVEFRYIGAVPAESVRPCGEENSSDRCHFIIAPPVQLMAALAQVSKHYSDADPYVDLGWARAVKVVEKRVVDYEGYLYDFTTETQNYIGNGVIVHNTHVIGILVGSGRLSNGKFMGFVPGAKIIAIKAFNKYGVASIETILDALEWIYRNAEKFHIDLCSFSWGIPKASDGSDPVSMAVDKIITDKHVLVVVAAGNEYFFPYTITIPAVCKHCIAVGAMDPYTNTIAPFSSAGPTKDGRIKPDFVGAGVWVVSTIPVTVKSWYEQFLEENHLEILKVGEGYAMMSGTSMATPCVAGIIAKVIEKLRSEHKPVTYETVLHEVLKWTRRINPLGKDIWTGWGVPQEP